MTYTNEMRDLVTNLNDSKELKKAYPNYPTRFVWHIQANNSNISIRLREKVTKWGDVELYPAFTADELVDLIKQNLEMFDKVEFKIYGNSHDNLVDDILHQFFIKRGKL